MSRDLFSDVGSDTSINEPRRDEWLTLNDTLYSIFMIDNHMLHNNLTYKYDNNKIHVFFFYYIFPHNFSNFIYIFQI